MNAGVTGGLTLFATGSPVQLPERAVEPPATVAGDRGLRIREAARVSALLVALVLSAGAS